ncbi:hypothetical protein RFI_32497 [Reticulomyxa filosa]|uniref:Uncharacterized protein n=1 Tax=Reticulomyxa filosa TaxID=46433 RepID=X6LUU6_RETFI|nr:hypothetical protein RFI_32497 [Reticulomyxa filosa]|eukprot:ETO04897.1 hypothetical protein RFI_32497 [Reticulomyxa filosa]
MVKMKEEAKAKEQKKEIYIYVELSIIFAEPTLKFPVISNQSNILQNKQNKKKMGIMSEQALRDNPKILHETTIKDLKTLFYLYNRCGLKKNELQERPELLSVNPANFVAICRHLNEKLEIKSVETIIKAQPQLLLSDVTDNPGIQKLELLLNALRDLGVTNPAVAIDHIPNVIQRDITNELASLKEFEILRMLYMYLCINIYVYMYVNTRTCMYNIYIFYKLYI